MPRGCEINCVNVHKILTMTGPYAYVRNPVYIANTIMFVSMAFFGQLYWFAPVMAVYCMVIYSIVVRYEESCLLAKYGQPYAEYIDIIPRWLPKFNQIQQHTHTNVSQFFVSSFFAEAPSLLLLVPFVIEEVIR